MDDRSLKDGVSVVVASFRGDALLDASLRSILPQARARNAPVVVARPGDATDVVRRLGYERDVVPVDAPAEATLPQIRGAGLRAVRSRSAALTEDHCVAADGWLDALCAAASQADAVGGRMGNAQRYRTVDWGAYFAEYGFFAGVAHSSRPALATGANVLYGPVALPQVAQWASQGLWEDVIHSRLIANGCRLTVTPRAVMQQNQRYALGAFCRDRIRHGCDYARVRLREQPGAGRWLRAVTSPLLPFVLARRLHSNVAADDRSAFLKALPVTMLFLGAWACGELWGYVRGPAPSSPE